MKVCIIAGHYANSGDGIGRYTANLVTSLKKLDKNIEIQVVGFNKNKSTAQNLKKKNVSLLPSQLNKYLMPLRVELGYYERFKKNNKILLENLKPVKADIYHAVSPSESAAAIKLNKYPLVTTIHDIIPLLGNNRYFLEEFYFKFFCKYAIKSDFIVADSMSSKQDIKRFLQIDEKKIKVIYPGIDENKFYTKQKSKNNSIKQILYLGGLVKRKGVYETVHAFKKLLETRTDVKLLIGGHGDEEKSLKYIVKQLNLQQFVEFLGFIDEKKLVEIYNSSDLFVYPSKYEGFGLTPLEAMASGVPVITSSTSSLPEVVGNAGSLVNPEDTNAIFKQMKLILNDENLQKKMSIQGVLQAKKFTWSNCAKETLDIYKLLT